MGAARAWVGHTIDRLPRGGAGRHVSHLHFFDPLLGDAPALAPPVIYYQRLLARDEEEATELVEDYIKAHPLEKVYDDVFIPALLLAWQDRQQGFLDWGERSFYSPGHAGHCG